MALRRRNGREALLKDFTLGERFCLMRGWHPHISIRTRWRTWEEFYEDSDVLRLELLADEHTRHHYPGLEIFADRLRRELQPGEAYDHHDHLGLRHSHAYVRGDRHTHDAPNDRTTAYALAVIGASWPLVGIAAEEVADDFAAFLDGKGPKPAI